MFRWRNKRALALGGGSARGIAHLGFLKVLEDHNLMPDMIIGTSFGAMIGGAYASGHYTVSELIEKLKDLIFSDEFKEMGIGLITNADQESNIKFINQLRESIKKIKFYHALLNRKFIVSNDKLEKVLRIIIPDINIEDMPVKFAAVALDLKTKKEFLMDKGSLVRSILASSCIPGVFEPVNMKNMLLVDGGWINKVPVPFARSLGADKIIAIDVSNPFHQKVEYKSGLALLRFADSITANILKSYQIMTADLVICPIRSRVEWFEFGKYKKIIQYGEKAALLYLPQIKKIFRKHFFS
ncbi:MAG: patatin-like phospholipase family protein [Spirochaetes bacterium]|nr:patatin-like phospholipase family protein [Spirochaetota bacterium]